MGEYRYHRYPPSLGTMSENMPYPLSTADLFPRFDSTVHTVVETSVRL